MKKTILPPPLPREKKKMRKKNWRRRTNFSRKRRRNWCRRWRPIPSPEGSTRTRGTHSTTKTWRKSSSGPKRLKKKGRKPSKSWRIKSYKKNERRKFGKSKRDESNTNARRRNERKNETRKCERKRWKARKSWKRKRRSFTSISCCCVQIFDTKTVERNQSILCCERCTAPRLRVSKTNRNLQTRGSSTKNSIRRVRCSNTWRKKICTSLKKSAWTCWNSSTRKTRRRRSIKVSGRASIAWRRQNWTKETKKNWRKWTKRWWNRWTYLARSKSWSISNEKSIDPSAKI